MGKVDRVVIKETGYIAAWVLIFSAVMQAVFLVIGAWNVTVLLGNLLSGVTGVLNFFMMGVTVQKSLDKSEKDAKLAMRVSMTVRLLAMFAVAMVGALIPSVFSIWAVLIPLVFPRLAILLRPLFGKKNGAAQTAATQSAVEDETDGETEERAEKAERTTELQREEKEETDEA